MDGLSAAARIMSETIHLLLNDIRAVKDAPEKVKLLEQNLLGIEQALASVRAITDEQWQSLGGGLLRQSTSITALGEESCTKFRATISHWKRHSEDDRLSWRDRTAIGVLKEGHLTAMSSQLQSFKSALTGVISMATLQKSFQDGHSFTEIRRMIAALEKEMMERMAKNEKQLGEIYRVMEALRIASLRDDETENDRHGALNQVEAQRKALAWEREVNGELLSHARDAHDKVDREQGGTHTTFGNLGQGIQMVHSYGTYTLNFGAPQG